ncbi:MAG: FtsH protease modulator YccA [Gammaproteobacteria bacterium]|nr:FtsH protease modulator YccA [Gammaproteobacteria bacterium]
MALQGLAHVSGQQAIEINGVLRNTYIMLGLSIGFAAFVSFVAMVLQIGMMNFFIYLAGFFGLSYAVQKTADSVWGLVWSFVFAGFLGLAMAPILGYYLAVQPSLVVQSFALTSAVFFALSAYTIVRRTDFSWLGSFLTVSFFVIIGIIVLSFFVNMSLFAMIISAFMVVVACALILYQTSAIVLGGERNYIIAANQLFVSFYILFLNLIQLLGIFGGDD